VNFQLLKQELKMTEPEPEIYVPKPGSLPWKVLSFLLANPDEELTRGDVGVKFDCIGAGIDAMLQLAVSRDALKKGRNSQMELVWILGLVKRFRLDPLPEAADDKQAKAPQPSAQAAAPAPAAPAPAPQTHRAIKVVEIAKPLALPQAPVHSMDTPVMVNMPRHLTPELIKAVQENPKTSFDSKADGHHAIGWLHDAYDVMVEARQKGC
jgi:hypothetical protein